MSAKVRLDGLEWVAAAAAAVTTWLFIGPALDAADMYLASRPVSEAMQMLGVLGWAVATFGPIGLAVCFRRIGRRASRPWLLHLLFLPCACALLLGGAEAMAFVAGDPDFDNSLGGPVLQAALLFGIALTGYFGAVLFSAGRRRRQIGADKARAA